MNTTNLKKNWADMIVLVPSLFPAASIEELIIIDGDYDELVDYLSTVQHLTRSETVETLQTGLPGNQATLAKDLRAA